MEGKNNSGYKYTITIYDPENVYDQIKTLIQDNIYIAEAIDVLFVQSIHELNQCITGKLLICQQIKDCVAMAKSVTPSDNNMLLIYLQEDNISPKVLKEIAPFILLNANTTTKLNIAQLINTFIYNKNNLNTIFESKILHSLLESSPIGVTKLDIYGKITYANKRAEEILGLTISDIKKRTYNAPEWKIVDYSGNKFPDEDLPFNRVMRECKPVHGIKHAICWPDGKTVYLSINGIPIFDSNNEIIACMFFIEDVSEIVNTEQSLYIKNNAIDSSINAIAFTDLQGSVNFVNNAFLKLWKINYNQIIGNNLSHFFKEKQSVNEIICTIQKEPLDTELVAVRTDNSEFHAQLHANVVYGNNNAPISLMISIIDVSLKHEALKNYQNSEERFRALFDTMPYGIQISNREGKITYSNIAHHKILGYNYPDVIGKYIWDFFETEQESENLKKYYQKIVAEKTEPTVYFGNDIIKKGRKIIIQIDWNYILDEQGNVTDVCSIITDITDRIDAERRLEESERRHRLISELSNDIIYSAKIKDQNYSLDWTSGDFEKITGYTEKEINQMPNKWQTIVHEEDRHVYDNLTQSSTQTSTPTKIQYRIKTKSGEIKWLQDQFIILWNKKSDTIDRILGSIVDITDEKAMQDQLKDSEATNRLLVELLPDAVVVHSKNKIVYVNPTVTKLFGGEDADYIGKDVLSLVHPDFRDLVKDRIQNVYSNNISAALIEEVFTKLDGSPINVEVTSIPFKYKNDPAALVVFRDITQRKQYEEALKREKEKAEESDKLKSAFLANMSHEIRTPMNGIIGFAEMLKQNDLDDEKRDYYTDIINKSCHQLLSIINDIVDISKIEAGQIETYPEITNINSIIDDIYNFFSPMASSKDLDLLLSKELNNKECNILTDQTRLKQVLNNLISNAFKFTKTGFVKIGYKLKGNDVLFFVEDTGIGIDKLNSNIIFDRFRQVEMDATRNFGGTGLGLSISKALVEKLKGKIWVESEKDQGSVFYFTLPNTTKKEDSTSHEKQRVLPSQTDFSNFHILVAEDEDINYLFLEELLMEYKFNVTRAINGIDAIEKFKNGHFDIILMDIKMPEMDGYEATAKIKQINKEIPIIAQTAYAMSGDKSKSIEAGCNDYVSKPLHREELIEKIIQLLNS